MVPVWMPCRFDAHTVRRVIFLAWLRLGSSIETSRAMMATTTKSSIRVNAVRFTGDSLAGEWMLALLRTNVFISGQS